MTSLFLIFFVIDGILLDQGFLIQLAQRAERIQKYSNGSFVGLGGFGKCALRFGLGHL